MSRGSDSLPEYIILSSERTAPQFLTGSVHLFVSSHVAEYIAFARKRRALAMRSARTYLLPRGILTST